MYVAISVHRYKPKSRLLLTVPIKLHVVFPRWFSVRPVAGPFVKGPSTMRGFETRFVRTAASPAWLLEFFVLRSIEKWFQHTSHDL